MRLSPIDLLLWNIKFGFMYEKQSHSFRALNVQYVFCWYKPSELSSRIDDFLP